MRGDVDHLLVGTSLPFLLPPGLHYLEAWSEALAEGGWGRRGARIGEKLRQRGDLEHWAAFQDGFQKVLGMTLEVARGERGAAPGTVTFLSGDVHHSYVVGGLPNALRPRNAADQPDHPGGLLADPQPDAAEAAVRRAAGLRHRRTDRPPGRAVRQGARRAVPLAPSPARGSTTASRCSRTDEGLAVSWLTGVVEHGDHEHPRLDTIGEELVSPADPCRVGDEPTPSAPRGANHAGRGRTWLIRATPRRPRARRLDRSETCVRASLD